MQSLSQMSATKHVFITPRDDDAADFIEEQCASLGISDTRVVEYDFDVSGQAECVMIATPHLQADKELLIFSLEAAAEPGGIKPELFYGDGHILCVSQFGKDMLNSSRVDAEMLNQNRLSEYDTTSAYFYFKSASLYEQLYYENYSNTKDNATMQRNIIPLYDRLLHSGGVVHHTTLQPGRVLALAKL